MVKYMISVDWLQVYCRYKTLAPLQSGAVFLIDGSEYHLRQASIHTAMFQEVATVYNRNLEVATLQWLPRSPKLDKNMVLLKLSNRVLYHAGFIDLLYKLMQVLDLTYKGITRLDVCHDSTRFYNDRSPSKFINDFVSKSNISSHDIRKKGSEEFTCHGKKPRGGSAKINYIRFGSPKSRVSAYIYDKTLELEEVHDKPWIRAAWDACGIDYSKDHVFRAEISIKAEGLDVLNMGTGELFRLSPEWLEAQIKIEHIFAMYSDKYLYFSIDGGQKRKKDFKRLQLFDLSHDPEHKPIQINRSADTGRIEKVCYNVLERLSSTYTDLSEYHRTAIEGTQTFLRELSGLKMGTQRHEAYHTYLNILKAYKFEDVELNKYFDSLAKAHELERSIVDNLFCE